MDFLKPEEIRYYLDTRNNILLAYERITDFFVMFTQEKEWKRCGITFMMFQHDQEYETVSKENALIITNERLPEAEFQEYLNMINQNRG